MALPPWVAVAVAGLAVEEGVEAAPVAEWVVVEVAVEVDQGQIDDAAVGEVVAGHVTMEEEVVVGAGEQVELEGGGQPRMDGSSGSPGHDESQTSSFFGGVARLVGPRENHGGSHCPRVYPCCLHSQAFC